MKFNFKGFKLICQAPTMELLEYLTIQMTEYYGEENVIKDDKWLYCKGNVPITLCSHLDTVHKSLPETVWYEPELQIIKSPQGIGGDDRCGVYISLEMLERMGEENKPHLFFSTDEETGSASTKEASKYLMENNKDIIDSLNFLVQLDRKGTNDSVYYNCDNVTFKTMINSYGFVEQPGSRTDISILCADWNLAGVNLSCGFNNEHRVEEFVSIAIMKDTSNKLFKIIQSMDLDIRYSYSPKFQAYVGNPRAHQRYYD